MRGPSIEFDSVGLALGNTEILRGVTFKVRAGTVHCIVGANGGGKTSLVRSLLGQMPHSGRIAIHWSEGRVIGYAMSLIVTLDENSPWYSYGEITGDGTFSTHDPAGDTLYGADIAVHPDFRGMGVALALYEGRKAILRRFDLRRMVAGGRIPGYRAHAGRMSAEEYIERVTRGELRDPALSVHLKAGYRVLNDVVLNQVLVSFGAADVTRRVIAAIQQDGTCWCGGTSWQGNIAMRISVSSWATTDEDVAQSIEAMLRCARDAQRA